MTSKLPHYLSYREHEEKRVAAEEKRRAKAASLGLPEDASSTDVYFAEKKNAIEMERKELISRFGLPEDTGWDEIRKKERNSSQIF